LKFIPTTIPEVIVIEPDVYRDERGFFLETYNARRYRSAGIPGDFVQDNHSRSVRNTIRGLHAQSSRPQGKLVRVVQGEVFDAAVDVRIGSPSFGHWVSVVLSAQNARQCYIPPGFAHGFCVKSSSAQLEYKCTDFYDPSGEIHLLWNDADIGIKWPVKDPILSPKDRAGVRLRDLLKMLPRFTNAA
jgi:dTDP-4-dehydrorhamnose 3,5-epimerase